MEIIWLYSLEQFKVPLIEGQLIFNSNPKVEKLFQLHFHLTRSVITYLIQVNRNFSREHFGKWEKYISLFLLVSYLWLHIKYGDYFVSWLYYYLFELQFFLSKMKELDKKWSLKILCPIKGFDLALISIVISFYSTLFICPLTALLFRLESFFTWKYFYCFCWKVQDVSSKDMIILLMLIMKIISLPFLMLNKWYEIHIHYLNKYNNSVSYVLLAQFFR